MAGDLNGNLQFKVIKDMHHQVSSYNSGTTLGKAWKGCILMVLLSTLLNWETVSLSTSAAVVLVWNSMHVTWGMNKIPTDADDPLYGYYHRFHICSQYSPRGPFFVFFIWGRELSLENRGHDLLSLFVPISQPQSTSIFNACSGKIDRVPGPSSHSCIR